MTNTPNSNAPSQAQLEAIVDALGELGGRTADVQIKFDLTMIEAAFLGTLSATDKNKHGVDIDDATYYAKRYWTKRNGAVIFDAKADNQRKTISNMRKNIKLGTCPKWGANQPMTAVNDLMNIWKTLKKQGKKMKDAHNCLMEYATEQLKMATIMDDRQMEKYCLANDAKEITIEDFYVAMRKKAVKLKNGKLSNCNDLDNSPELENIIASCGKRLTAIAKAKGGTP